ncbi:MAG TPA: TPM domain-containing protein, partial [Mycobacteriales bacterium]|nr:TPM domain-containing protein [Mycobacteriales bacterium]
MLFSARRCALVGASTAVVALALQGVARAQVDCDRFPEPSAYVVDEAGVVDDATERSLNAALQSFESSSGGHQVAALVVSSIGDRGIEDYANDVFGCWGIGEAGEDTGALLLVAME